MFFVLHHSGTGGNMVSAVIDSKDYIYSDVEVIPKPITLRQRFRLDLMKYHADFKKDCRDFIFTGNDKSEYYKRIEQKYISVTTEHDLTFIQHKHNVKDAVMILIDDSEYKYCRWALERAHAILPKCHPPASEELIASRINEVNIAKTCNPNIIPLKDILEGRLIEVLQQWVDTPLNTEMYDMWLKNMLPKYPPNF